MLFNSNLHIFHDNKRCANCSLIITSGLVDGPWHWYITMIEYFQNVIFTFYLYICINTHLYIFMILHLSLLISVQVYIMD